MTVMRWTTVQALVWAFGLSCGTACAQEKPDLFVLSVGIDRYQAPTNGLRGCVNDATGLVKVLQGQTGKKFGRVDAVTLTDSQATKAAVATELSALEKKGRAGDWYVVFMSGVFGSGSFRESPFLIRTAPSMPLYPLPRASVWYTPASPRPRARPTMAPR